MNQTVTLEAWSPSTPHDPMASTVVEDFTSFLDMADFSSFPSLDLISTQDHRNAHQAATERMDTGPDGCEDLLRHIRTDIHLQHDHAIQQEQQQSSLSAMGQLHDSADVLFGMDMQAQLMQEQEQQQQQQQQQQQHQQRQQQQLQMQMQEHVYQGQYMIPPTPNSIEMRGGAARYYQQVDAQTQAQALRYQRLKEDQMIFTPLVSPAVTPLEANFALPEYTIPGAYLSPLTSPAIEAQSSISHRVNYHKSSRSDTSIASSPLDVLDSTTLVSTTCATSQPGTAKRVRRTSIANRNPARVVRQSPSMKPQRKKAPVNTILPTKDRVEHILDAQSQSNGAKVVQSGPGGLSIPRGRETSESESISPEPLSEALMPPPPPPPRSVSGRESSTGVAGANHVGLAARAADGNGSSSDLHPATPASLMRLQKQPPPRVTDARRPSLTLDVSVSAGPENTGKSAETHGSSDVSASSNSNAGLDVTTTDDLSQVTPTVPARKPRTSKLSNTPTSAVSAGDERSPLLKGLTSPQVVASGKKADGKASRRAGTKRTTSGSVHVSPALRPKISPSIKPLLPEGVTLSAEASALLLASKSNYQNILEGNHLPGVSYPEALSTNLTSKRTSHKIAEQGRRNRINQALQEIASLLPPTMPGKDSAPGSGGEGSSGGGGGGGNHVGGGGGGGGGQQQLSNSKASTVEMAIEYIRALQRDLSETKGKLEAAEKKLEEKSMNT
ncbi:MAG: hypothetical protein M1816_006978 [Peltula sp. TS41687]|nr:MAG: hypothetical protein M1816_006978 [Peltula sp. TS41687]